MFKPTYFPDTEIKVMHTLQRRKKFCHSLFPLSIPIPTPLNLFCNAHKKNMVLHIPINVQYFVLHTYFNIQSNFKDLWANISTLLTPMQDTSTFQILLFKQHKQLRYVYVNEEIIYAYKYSLVYDWQPSMQFDLWPQTYTYSSALVSWYLMNSLEKNKSNM